MTPIETFRDFVKECAPEKIHKEWVIWMLDDLSRISGPGTTLNPAWLRASYNVTGIYSQVGPYGTDEPDWNIGDRPFHTEPFKELNINPGQWNFKTL